MPDYVIRRATAADIVHLPSVEKRAAAMFTDWLAETGLTRELMGEVSSIEEFAEAQQRGHLWVAVADRSPVGFALVELLGPAVHLEELDVVPEHGRRGIGLRLLETVCAWAMAAGHPSVTLSTFTAVPWNAPFYQRHGFHVVKPADVSPQHVALVDAERARGLRTDLRVLMEYKTSGRRVG